MPNLSDYDCTNYSYCIDKMRLPSGTIYKKTPIVIFGSSFAHGGKNLTQTQTFSHKLSTFTRRPVYNEAVQKHGLSLMLWLTENNDFYSSVPEADTYIYIFTEDEFRTMLSYKYSPTDTSFLLKYLYDINTKNLSQEKNLSPLQNFIKSTYIMSFYDEYKIKNYISNVQNADIITDMAVQYFIQSRQNIQNHYNKKVKFVVVLYIIPTIFKKIHDSWFFCFPRCTI